MPRLLSSLLASILVSSLVQHVVAQVPKELLGTWVGTGDDNRGEKLAIEANAIVIEGERLALKLHAPGVLVLGGDNGERAEFSIVGDKLTLTVDGEAMQYRRDGAPKPPPDEPRPAGNDTPPPPKPPTRDNPLAKKPLPPADPFARRFKGDAIEMVLDGNATAGYRGKLTFQGEAYPAEARAKGNILDGKFRAGADWHEFRATLAADRLELESGGSTYVLEGERKDPAPTMEGTAGTGNDRSPDRPTVDTKAPPALTGVFDGKTKRFEHPRGWFGFDMPDGWSVHSESGTGMLINPGLSANDTLDAILGLLWGRLEANEQNQPVGKVIEQRIPLLRQALGEQGFTVGEPEGKVETFKGKDVPGAVIVFRGQTAQGHRFQIWFGGIVKRDAWISVSGVLLDGKEDVYLPKLKRIFTSLEPRPPERNQKLEAALVGRTFNSSQYGRITESAHHASYGFAAGGACTRRLMSNVISKPGLPGVSADSEVSGRYEVCGDILYLYFESGQEVGRVVQNGGAVTAIQIGNAVYQ